MRTPHSHYKLCIQIFTLLFIQGIKDANGQTSTAKVTSKDIPRATVFLVLITDLNRGLEILDSLQCVHDFKKHWICQWRETEKVREILPMSLYHWDSVNRNRGHCNPDSSYNQEDGKVHMSCTFYGTFSSTVVASLTFAPERDVHGQISIIPAANVQMLPPRDLKLQLSNNGKIGLTWEMPKHVHISAPFLYQVVYYRKDWETWEDAVSLNVLGKMEVNFSPQSFVPGSTYVFRVRSVRHEDPAYRSAWSKELTWAMPADNGTIIQNLNCKYDGSAEMDCSWEVRRELINSVSFSLYYSESPKDGKSASPEGMKSCRGEIGENKESVPYVQYKCSVEVPSSHAHNSFSIQVRTQEEVKDFKGCENIQTEPPTDLKIKTKSRNGYTLIWSPPELAFKTMQLIYQLCYWKEGDPECPPYLLVNISGNTPEYFFPISKLEGSTYYTAKVRAKPDEKTSYSGSWSEWSQSRSWKTSIVLATDIICLCAVIISIAVSLLAFFAYKYYKRLKQSLNDSLPNPSKSKLLSNQTLGYWKQNFYPFIHQDFYAEEEKPSICFPVSPVAPQSTHESTEELVTEKIPNHDVGPLGPYSLPLAAEEKKIMPDQSKSLSTGEKSNLTTESTSEATKSLNNKSYNGPYLIFTGGQSMANLVPNKAKHSGYFSLPKCQPETFNVPKETIRSCQPQPPGDQMGYVISMEKPLSAPPMQNQDKKIASEKSYLAIPAPSDFHVTQEGPVMIINPDGSGPLLLKQVGDYCFFPGLRGSQENLERKSTPASEQNQQNVPENLPLSAVQAFKVMQRGYLALPRT